MNKYEHIQIKLNIKNSSVREENKNFNLEIRNGYLKYQAMPKAAIGSSHTGGCWKSGLDVLTELSPYRLDIVAYITQYQPPFFPSGNGKINDNIYFMEL